MHAAVRDAQSSGDGDDMENNERASAPPVASAAAAAAPTADSGDGSRRGGHHRRRAAWQAPRLNAMLAAFDDIEAMLSSMRLPLALSTLSYADQWWLSWCDATRVRFLCFVSVHMRIARVVPRWEPVGVVLQHALHTTVAFATLMKAMAFAALVVHWSSWRWQWWQWSLMAARIAPSLGILLFMFALVIPMRYVVVQALWFAYLLCARPAPYVVRCVQFEPITSRRRGTHRRGGDGHGDYRSGDNDGGDDGDDDDDDENDHGSGDDDDDDVHAAQPPPFFSDDDDLEYTEGPMQVHVFVSDVRMPAWRPMCNAVAFYLFQALVVTLLSALLGGAPFAARIVYECLPLAATLVSVTLRRNGARRSPFVVIGDDGDAHAVPPSAHVLWHYVVPRVALACTLDAWLRRALLPGVPPLLFVACAPALEFVLATREISTLVAPHA